MTVPLRLFENNVMIERQEYLNNRIDLNVLIAEERELLDELYEDRKDLTMNLTNRSIQIYFMMQEAKELLSDMIRCPTLQEFIMLSEHINEATMVIKDQASHLEDLNQMILDKQREINQLIQTQPDEIFLQFR